MTRMVLRAICLMVCSAVLFPAVAARGGADDSSGVAAPGSRVNWADVLGPPQGAVPPPRPAPEVSVEVPTFRQLSAMSKIHWETDLAAALETARKENRPLFVTLRCLPCRTCSEFDKQVLEGGPELDPLFRQFVTVRITNTKDVDLRLLPMPQFQDMDVSWWSWFLSPAGQVYGVFGGRDHVSDLTRTSKPALVETMRRVLAHHYDPRREKWSIDGPAPDVRGERQTPAGLPGFASWLEKTGPDVKEGYAKNACVHCHQVSEILRQPAIDAKTFDKHRDLEIWPLPENVGLKVVRDDGLKVEKVESGSAAENAGLRAGDVLGAAGGRRLFSQADFRAVLHRLPREAKSVEVQYVRDGKVQGARLELAEGWKKSRIDWRPSVGESNIGGAPGFWPTAASDKRREERGVPKGTMAVQPHFGFRGKPSVPAYEAGLRDTDVIVAVDGDGRDVNNRAWLVWFRMNHEPGDEVKLTVQDGPGKTRVITYRAK